MAEQSTTGQDPREYQITANKMASQKCVYLILKKRIYHTHTLNDEEEIYKHENRGVCNNSYTTQR